MSRSPLRKDKTCLNCNYVVENRFCPNCGQENTDTRKTFYHLFVHFFEDLTHYENSFWKTIKNLLLKPASLTKEYLSGKRMSYLAPVRLYIFVSFITFFIITILPASEDALVKVKQTTSTKVKDENGVMKDSIISVKRKKISEIIKEKENEELSRDEKNTKRTQQIEQLKKRGVLSKTEADSLKLLVNEIKTNSKTKRSFMNLGYGSIEEMDSIRKVNPDEISDFVYNLNKKVIQINKKYTIKEIKEKFLEGIQHNFPKALFIYMPLFAFILWVFHNKKRWYYFDHGIFTLHYFSFLLLVVFILFLFGQIMNLLPENGFTDLVSQIVKVIGYLWMFYYFFPAHHRFYGESRTISFLKSITMFCINVILMSIVLLVFIVYTFINIH